VRCGKPPPSKHLFGQPRQHLTSLIKRQNAAGRRGKEEKDKKNKTGRGR